MGCTGLVIGSIYYIPWAVRIFTKCFIGALVFFGTPWQVINTRTLCNSMYFNQINSHKHSHQVYNYRLDAQNLEYSSDVPLECFPKSDWWYTNTSWHYSVPIGDHRIPLLRAVLANSSGGQKQS